MVIVLIVKCSPFFIYFKLNLILFGTVHVNEQSHIDSMNVNTLDYGMFISLHYPRDLGGMGETI